MRPDEDDRSEDDDLSSSPTSPTSGMTHAPWFFNLDVLNNFLLSQWAQSPKWQSVRVYF